MFNFNISSNREGTNSEKYTMKKELFGTSDITPLWVADMDIDTPIFVLDAMVDRLKHPVLGYESVPKSMYQAQISWLDRRYGAKFDIADMIYSPSVVASIGMAIEAFSDIGDNIIVQTPVYPQFFKSIKRYKRDILENPLIEKDDGSWIMDIKNLKSQINKKTKLLILCNPHNPVGRSWHKKELKELLDICIQNNIIVFSDEIHCDLVYAPHRHTVFANINGQAKDITISAFGVGKTFNLAGISASTVAIQNERLKKKFMEVYNKIHFPQGSILSCVAFETAYKYGDTWLEELKIHLWQNYISLKNLCDKYPQYIKITPIEATYLAWLDCKSIGKNSKQIESFFIDKAKLGLSRGVFFGKSGSGFMRLNFAVSTAAMAKALRQLDTALRELKH